MMLDSRPVDLKYWFALSDEWAQTDYCTKRLHHTGDYEPLDIEHQLLVATVDLDPRAIEAAFRKLAGKPSTANTPTFHCCSSALPSGTRDSAHPALPPHLGVVRHSPERDVPPQPQNHR